MRFYISICDGIQEDCNKYRNLCLEIGKKNALEIEVQTYSTETQLLFAIESHSDQCHVIFIDIKNCGVDGIGTLEKIKERYQDKEVIFLTRSKAEFREAFDISAFNYIVKNEDTKERFSKVLLQALKKVGENEKEHIIFSCAGESRCVPVKDILYFEMLNRVITVYYGNSSFEFISTLSKLEAHLENYGFIRMHKAFLIAGGQIESLRFKAVTLKNGCELPVGRAYYKRAKEQLNKMYDRCCLDKESAV